MRENGRRGNIYPSIPSLTSFPPSQIIAFNRNLCENKLYLLTEWYKMNFGELRNNESEATSEDWGHFNDEL